MASASHDAESPAEAINGSGRPSGAARPPQEQAALTAPSWEDGSSGRPSSGANRPPRDVEQSSSAFAATVAAPSDSLGAGGRPSSGALRSSSSPLLPASSVSADDSAASSLPAGADAAPRPPLSLMQRGLSAMRKYAAKAKSVAVIVGLLCAWYVSNILYNIYNKQVREKCERRAGNLCRLTV